MEGKEIKNKRRKEYSKNKKRINNRVIEAETNLKQKFKRTNRICSNNK